MPHPEYKDDARTKRHALQMADVIEAAPIDDNGGWPVVVLPKCLPSVRTMIVRGLRDLADKLPED